MMKKNEVMALLDTHRNERGIQHARRKRRQTATRVASDAKQQRASQATPLNGGRACGMVAV